MQNVINADDFGRDKETSDAIIKAFNSKLINRTTVMVNMDYFDEAYNLSINNGFSAFVGLHLNLTAGEPLTDRITHIGLFCDGKGRFNGKLMQNAFNRLLPLSREAKEAVYDEIEAQFRKYIAFYGNHSKAYHMDSHHHVHKNMSILPICLKMVKKYNFQSMRFAKTAGSFVNCCYNKLVNKTIIRATGQTYYLLFDSVKDYMMREQSIGLNDYYEVECHPKEKNGELYDGEEKMISLDCYRRAD